MADETDYTRTFIGARYVPKFEDYSATAVYEPLTMVVVNDNIYISKQFVPAGVAISNTEYWSMMPAFDTNSQQAITTAVNNWLTAHPEATTTVQDGSITNAKLVQSSGILSEVIDGRLNPENYNFPSIGDNIRNNFKLIEHANNYLNEGKKEVFFQWEDGNIDTTTGEEIEGRNNYRTGYFAKDSIDTIIKLISGGNLRAFFYNYDETTDTYSYVNSLACYPTVKDYSEDYNNKVGTHVRFAIYITVFLNITDRYFIGKSSELIKNINNSIYNLNGYYTNNFTVNAGSTHSSLNHRLNVDIKNGETFYYKFSKLGNRSLQIYFIIDDGSNYNYTVPNATQYLEKTLKFVANGNIKQIGVFVGNSDYEENYIHEVFTNNVSKYLPYKPSNIYISLDNNKEMTFTKGKARNLVQGINILNNSVWEFAQGKAFNNGVEYEIANGHGNNSNWGNVLHGDYPYLYCPTWVADQFAINVNSFDGTQFTLMQTINLINFTGVGTSNAYVDELNNKIYWFIADTASSGNMTYIISDLSGNIIYQHELFVKMPAFQDLDYFNGKFYIVGGLGSSASPNMVYVVSTNGNVEGAYSVYGMGELEGIAFLNNKMLLASYYYFYYNPEMTTNTDITINTLQVK